MKELKRWLPAIIMMLIIFGFSSIKGATIESAGLSKPAYNINGHFILYLMLGFAMFKGAKDYLMSFELALWYATLDEIHQLFIPGRSWQILDLKVDAISIILALLLIWGNIIPKKLKNWLLN